MEFQDIINLITGFVGSHYDDFLAIIGAFAVIARWSPNKSDDSWVQFILDGTNFIAMNHGKATNSLDV